MDPSDEEILAEHGAMIWEALQAFHDDVIYLAEMVEVLDRRKRAKLRAKLTRQRRRELSG
jgi:predicted amino acid-binding ACT domain protein